MIFLQKYSTSKSKEFVLSKFKYIIEKQWDEMWWEILLFSAFNWLHIIFITIIMVYRPFLVLIIFDFLWLFMIFFHEMVSFYIAKLEYLKDSSNYYDWLMIGLCLYLLVSLCKGTQVVAEVKFFTLIIIYTRTLFYLKIFKPFRYLIHMLVQVTYGAFTTFLLIFYFIVVFAFLKYALTDGQIRFYLFF